MQERRRAARQRTFKSGIIAFNRAGGIDCTIRNLSPIGACLEVESLLGIPTEFDLKIEKENVHYACRVVWRQNKRLGVDFGDVRLL
jgi:hypothetical protein